MLSWDGDSSLRICVHSHQKNVRPMGEVSVSLAEHAENLRKGGVVALNDLPLLKSDGTAMKSGSISMSISLTLLV